MIGIVFFLFYYIVISLFFIRFLEEREYFILSLIERERDREEIEIERERIKKIIGIRIIFIFVN